MGVDFPHKWKNKAFDWNVIFPLQRINFEHIQVNAPNIPKIVLEKIYGHYMSIPKDSYPRHSSYLDINENERNILENIAK